MMREIDSNQIRLIAGLAYAPGYLLLLDYLQAQFDTLTNDLDDSNLVGDAAVAKLHYWRAFRNLLHTLQTQPAAFAAQLTPEEQKQDEIGIGPSNFTQMQQLAQQYLQGQITQ